MSIASRNSAGKAKLSQHLKKALTTERLMTTRAQAVRIKPKKDSIGEKASKPEMYKKSSIRLPSDCVINDKIIIFIIQQLCMDAVENIIDAAIQELDRRVGDCDLEPEVESDVDGDNTNAFAIAQSSLSLKPRVATVSLPIVRQDICST